MKSKLNEDGEGAAVPVTSTDNGGAGLNEPILPMTKKDEGIFRRYMNIKRKLKTLNKQ